MKVKGIRWVGVVTDDYDKTKEFWGQVPGLDQEWTNNDKDITFFRFPSGQEVEVYSPANRLRKQEYNYFKGPVLGIEVDNSRQACEETAVQGFELISEVESTEDGQVSWLYFVGPAGHLYSLHQHLDAPNSQ